MMLGLEVQINSAIHSVTPYIWRSWTGRRFIDGREVHGPVFLLGSDTPSPDTQRRNCPCDICFYHLSHWRVDS